jgi:hypothetical protein
VAAPLAAEAAYPVPEQPARLELTETLPDWQQVLYADLVDSPQYAAELAQAISIAAEETAVPAELIWGVAYTESHGRQWNGTGQVKRGSAGEVGLMQVKPFWASAIKREYGVTLDLWQVADNVRAGAYILKRGGGDTATMLGYYNTGKHIRGTRYQRRVTQYMERLDELADSMPLASPSTLGLSEVQASAMPANSSTLRQTWPVPLPAATDATAQLAWQMGQRPLEMPRLAVQPKDAWTITALARMAHWASRVAAYQPRLASLAGSQPLQRNTASRAQL